MTAQTKAERFLKELEGAGLTHNEISFLARATYGARCELECTRPAYAEEAERQWGAVKTLQDHLIQEDRQRAFALGVALATTPSERSETDPHRESVRISNIATGLQIISDTRLLPFLSSQLLSPQGFTLKEVIRGCIEKEIIVPIDRSQLNTHPEFFASAVAILIALQLEDDELGINDLAQIARHYVERENFQRLLNHYMRIDATREMAERILHLIE